AKGRRLSPRPRTQALRRGGGLAPAQGENPAVVLVLAAVMTKLVQIMSRRRRRTTMDSPIDLLAFAGKRRFATILVDPPWRFANQTGKIAPEHRRLARYRTLSLDEIVALPVGAIAAETAHLYLWCPNALLPEGRAGMQAWGVA